MAWHTLYSQVQDYVFKIQTPEGSGTGFLFAFNHDRTIAAIGTALHVVRHADDWQLPVKLTQHSTAKVLFLKEEDRAIIVDYQRDSAAIVIRANSLDLPKDVLPILDKTKYKKVGVALGWVGYPALAPTKLCFFQGGVSARVEEDDSYLIDGVAIHGVSGGPVFAEKAGSAQIVGIVSGYFANRQQGEALPGLLKAHDVTHLHRIIATINSMDEARQQAEHAAKQQESPAAEDLTPSETAPSEGTPPAASN